jgi:hypothetical protein
LTSRDPITDHLLIAASGLDRPTTLRDFTTDGGNMRKLAIGITGAVALLLAGILAWNAEATTLTSAATAHTATNLSLVEQAGCWLKIERPRNTLGGVIPGAAPKKGERACWLSSPLLVLRITRSCSERTHG